MKNIAIFASGSGTNAENLIRFFRTNPFWRGKTGVDEPARCRCDQTGPITWILRLLYSTGSNFTRQVKLLDAILRTKTLILLYWQDFFGWFPSDLLEHFEGKIVNIHPALLPKYGGKGMYGSHVHEAVIASGDTESGITIHHVNREYDEGDIIFQATCKVEPEIHPRSWQKEYMHWNMNISRAVVEQLLKSFKAFHGDAARIIPKLSCSPHESVPPAELPLSEDSLHFHFCKT